MECLLLHNCAAELLCLDLHEGMSALRSFGDKLPLLRPGLYDHAPPERLQTYFVLSLADVTSRLRPLEEARRPQTGQASPQSLRLPLCSWPTQLRQAMSTVSATSRYYQFASVLRLHSVRHVGAGKLSLCSPSHVYVITMQVCFTHPLLVMLMQARS